MTVEREMAAWMALKATEKREEACLGVGRSDAASFEKTGADGASPCENGDIVLRVAEAVRRLLDVSEEAAGVAALVVKLADVDAERAAARALFEDRGPVGHGGRYSIPKSHRAEGTNFVD
jgi:hypothetical protein